MAPDLILDIPNDLSSIEEAVDFVMQRCTSCGEDPRRLRLNLRVGLAEALANAMLYGNARDPSKRVKVEVAFQDSAITARVTDEGTGFDPLSLPDPTCPANLLKANGRGIFLMRKLLDEVHFNDRGNSVTLVLRLPRVLPDEGPEGGAKA
ncbi:MAG: ATP-binding protein [Gemmatimonadota bacterium]|jgi:serine/threonine-protein kinase RsbW